MLFVQFSEFSASPVTLPPAFLEQRFPEVFIHCVLRPHAFIQDI
jgi:hypothetical protein